MSKNRIKKTIGTTALALVLGGVGVTAFAAEGSNIDSEVKAAPDEAAMAVSRHALADELIAYGDAAKDAVALVVAAKIKAEHPISVKEGDEKGGEPKSTGTDASVSAVLARASEMAQGDAAVLAMIEDVKATGARGYINGALCHDDRILSRDTDVYEDLVFEGGEYAHIALRGDGDTDLDLKVYDENGNEIDTSTGSTDREAVSFTPRWTGPFRIEIKNYGRVYNDYTLCLN